MSVLSATAFQRRRRELAKLKELEKQQQEKQKEKVEKPVKKKTTKK